jgi:hypothetical protein
LHAADVLHCVSMLAKEEKISAAISDMELLALYLSAIIHGIPTETTTLLHLLFSFFVELQLDPTWRIDHDHPGLNNNFLVNTHDPKAVLYNDKSVLENHHCAAAFQHLMNPENNFIEKLDKKVYRQMRTQIVDMVLSTDLAQHFSLLTVFKKKVRSCAASEDFVLSSQGIALRYDDIRGILGRERRQF